VLLGAKYTKRSMKSAIHEAKEMPMLWTASMDARNGNNCDPERVAKLTCKRIAKSGLWKRIKGTNWGCALVLIWLLLTVGYLIRLSYQLIQAAAKLAEGLR
jgi:hypothetical protein